MLTKKYYFFFKNLFLDFFFPKTCLGCGKEGEWVCEECIKNIKIINQPFCPQCRRPTLIGEFCDVCRRGGVTPLLQLNGIIICAHYEEGILKELIHQFKYNFIYDIGELLGELMTEKLKMIYRECRSAFPIIDIVIPVPLHKKRQRARGFNQAEILAKKIAQEFSWQLNTQSLKRIKFSLPQTELTREQRLKNLKEAFQWYNINTEANENLPLQNKNILLVDDVTTTGTTLKECAQILKQKGAGKIWGIVLGKG